MGLYVMGTTWRNVHFKEHFDKRKDHELQRAEMAKGGFRIPFVTAAFALREARGSWIELGKSRGSSLVKCLFHGQVTASYGNAILNCEGFYFFTFNFKTSNLFCEFQLPRLLSAAPHHT